MIQTWLWLHCLWICLKLLPVDAWSCSKPCSPFVPGCLQNFSRIQLCVEANEPTLYFRRKKLSLQYCLKLNCNYNNPAYATVFDSKFHSVFERKPTQIPPLTICVSGDLQKVGFKNRAMLLHLLYQPLLHSTLHRQKQHSSQNLQTSFFMNFVMSSRITIAYLLMALKKVTELLLLWSIKTKLRLFDYLIQQTSSELNYMPFACDRCGPTLKRKEFSNLFWFHVKSAFYQRL